MELSLPFLARPRRTRVKRRGRGAAWRARLLERLPSSPLALRATLCTLLAVALLGGGWLWLRGSSLVSVRHVHIAGVHGAEALEIRAALDAAAKRMTTMDFSTAQLRSAVAPFAVVGGLRVTTSFPHTVRISVTERMPVAVLLSHGQRTALAADGTVLGSALATSTLPQIAGSIPPRAGARLSDAAALADVAVIGAAPKPLARYVTRVFEGREGLTVAMSSGLLVYFGDASRPHAKWLSLARVLVSPSSAGALYVDVRLPERPAAGMSPESSSAASGTVAGAGSAESTTAALAASLSNAAGGGSATTTSTTEAASTGESEASSGESEASSTGSEASSSGESETPTSGEGEASAPESQTSPEG